MPAITQPTVYLTRRSHDEPSRQNTGGFFFRAVQLARHPRVVWHWARLAYYNAALASAGPAHPDALLLSEQCRRSARVLEAFLARVTTPGAQQ